MNRGNRVFVREHPPELTAEKIQGLLKPGLTALPYRLEDEVGEAPLIVGEREIGQFRDEHSFVVNYEKLMEEIEGSLSAEYKQNYPYYFMRSAMERAKQPDIHTLIAGNSYFTFGVEGAMMSGAVNCSLPSQDLYYSDQIVRQVCRENDGLKTVIFGGGYYYFHSDLSRSAVAFNRKLVRCVYRPLLGSTHHCFLAEPTQMHLMDSEWIDMPRMLDVFCAEGYARAKGSYFRNAELGRRRMATRLWEDQEKQWVDLTREERELAGLERARRHNKALEHRGTLAYNTKLFDKMVDWYQSRGVRLVMVICPATPDYRRHLSLRFKEIYEEILNRHGDRVHRIDFFDHPAFGEEDFNDMDHLSASGARKLTDLLRTAVEELDTGAGEKQAKDISQKKKGTL